MADATFNDLCDQLATMLGADGLADLPSVDQTRLGIFVNQAYRECYAPINGSRPRWASKRMELSYDAGENSASLGRDVIDVQKQPELVGVGPLSPMAGENDELRLRTDYAGDFSPRGRYTDATYTITAKEPETGTPIWYYVDQVDDGDDDDVLPRLFLYPIPDKAFTVKLSANVLPAELSGTDEPRLPGNVVWDILFPLAQGKILSDPRYNGDNKEIIFRMAQEARDRLKTFTSPQKHKNTRLYLRKGW